MFRALGRALGPVRRSGRANIGRATPPFRRRITPIAIDVCVRSRFLPEDREIETPAGTTVLDAAHEHDVPVETVCSGKGTCGTCRVLIRGVDVPPPNAHDRRRLSDQQLVHGWRLACQHPVAEGAVYTHPVGVRTVRVVESSGLGRIRLDPDVQKIYVKPAAPSLHDQSADWSRIQDELAAVAGDLDPTLEALARLAAIGEQVSEGVTIVIAGNRIVSVEPGDTTARGFGMAFDVGTTTVVGALMNLTTGEEAAVASGLNGQHLYGGDVISRMSVTMRGPAWVRRLTEAVRDTIREIIAACLEKSGVAPHEVYELTFVGNTVMEHLLIGADPSRISYSPFVPTTVDPVTCTAAELGLNVLPSAPVWVAPNAASYVGGDIVGMMLSANLGRRRGNVLAIDVGTNGEIVLQKGAQLYATAAPAGPAFEGAEISQGMRAAPGAVERVRVLADDVELDVIGGGEPMGICGSGLVDAVAELLRAGAVAPSGRLLSLDEVQTAAPGLAHRIIPDETGGAFVLSGSADAPETALKLHAQDIRQLQLAKGSIRCGVNVLLTHANLRAEDLDEVILAGAFGSYIDPAGAIAIGLVPDVGVEAIRAVGNAAGHGARMCLLSLTSRVRAVDLPARVVYVELSAVPDFQDEFALAMGFPAPSC